jgi:arabinogalactan oligomer/maltooligosaccharide transport system substrate-binding protein
MHGFRKFATLVAMAAIAIGACSSGGASPAASAGGGASQAPATQAPASQAGASASAAASGGLSGSITIWEAYGASGSAEKDAFDTMVANVQAANPGLTVTVLDVPFANLFTKFEQEAASGGGPDLYIAPNDSLPKEARAGLLKDVSSLEATLKAAPYNTSQVAIDAAKVDGKLYEIPESMKAVELFYNNAILTTAPVTTDDWMKNAKQLGWVYGSNGGGAYYLWGLYSTFGGKIMDDSGKCVADQAGVPDALKWLQDMKAAGMHFYQGDNDAKADLISGKIGGFIDGPWQSGDLSKALGTKLAVVAGPKATGAWAPMTAPDGYYINSASKNADLAIQFALAMLQPSNEQIFADKAGHLPANTTIQPTDPIAKSFAALMPSGFPRPTAKQLDNYWGNFGNALVAAIDKGTDAKAAVTTACQAMNKANGL